MLADGFTIEQMVELVRAGLATAHAERVVAGGKRLEVATLRITDAGRRVAGIKPVRTAFSVLTARSQDGNTMDTKQLGFEFAKRLANMSPEERARINERNLKEALEQHKRFSDAFKTGRCYLCGDALTDFNESKPCQHWLLKPKGFSKQHLERLAAKHSWAVLEYYLRWVANEEAVAKNINDLADEGTGKLVELTIRYKDLEWSFSCGTNDLSGHEGGGEPSKRPHYHFQMYVDGKPFIRFNDFHLPLSAADVGFLEHMRQNPGKVRRRLPGGTGMNEMLEEHTLEHVVRASDVESAPIRLNTLIMAEPGKTISGDDLYNLFQAAKAEGVTVTSKLHELKGVSIQTFVLPGPGAVQQATRSGRRKRRGDGQLRAQDRAWREHQKRGQ